jgi:hypothetical protein
MPDLTWTLLLDGVPAPRAVVDAVEDIEVESHLGLAAILRLRLAVALTEDGSRWTVVDDGLFRRLGGVRLLLTAGAGPPAVLFDGYVAETDLSLSEDPGLSALTVVALDATVLMNLQERVREWPNMPDSVIAAAVFGEYGLVPVVEVTHPVRTQLETTVVQRDTDIRFLRHLAHRNGFDLYLKPGPVPGVVEGHFHRPVVDLPPRGVLSVHLGQLTNVRSFTARHEMLRPTAASASGVDARTVARQPAEARAAQSKPLGRRPLLNGDRPRATLLRVGGPSRTGELQTLAQATADRSSWAVTAEGELETALYGDVLEAGSTVLVRGAGPTFSGTYLVERVLHKIQGEDASQHFTLRRNALEAVGTEVYLPDLGLPS